jgi:curved DNA-binding protein CbpA
MIMAEPPENPYTILGLARGVDDTAIKQAYFALVRSHPPERDPDAFKRIRGAYERLRDPKTRAETDMLLPVRWTMPGKPGKPARLDLTLHVEDVLEAAEALSDLSRTDWHAYQRKVTL